MDQLGSICTHRRYTGLSGLQSRRTASPRKAGEKDEQSDLHRDRHGTVCRAGQVNYDKLVVLTDQRARKNQSICQRSQKAG